MTNHTEIIRIRSDDCLFIITAKTLNKFPSSLFYNVINKNLQSDLIFKDGNTLYVDIMPENVKKIISLMRGYKLYNLDESLKFDLQRLDLTDLIIQDNNPDNILSDSKSDNYARNLFEKLFTNNNHHESVTSISELYDPLSSINFKIVRPKKEKLDSF